MYIKECKRFIMSCYYISRR